MEQFHWLTTKMNIAVSYRIFKSFMWYEHCRKIWKVTSHSLSWQLSDTVRLHMCDVQHRSKRNAGIRMTLNKKAGNLVKKAQNIMKRKMHEFWPQKPGIPAFSWKFSCLAQWLRAQLCTAHWHIQWFQVLQGHQCYLHVNFKNNKNNFSDFISVDNACLPSVCSHAIQKI